MFLIIKVNKMLSFISYIKKYEGVTNKNTPKTKLTRRIQFQKTLLSSNDRFRNFWLWGQYSCT